MFNFPNKLSLHGVKIVDIACGRSHILMLSDKGDVYSVGEGRFVALFEWVLVTVSFLCMLVQYCNTRTVWNVNSNCSLGKRGGVASHSSIDSTFTS